MAVLGRVGVVLHVLDILDRDQTAQAAVIIHQGQLKALGTVDELCRTFAVEGGLEPLFLKIAAGKGAGE